MTDVALMFIFFNLIINTTHSYCIRKDIGILIGLLTAVTGRAELNRHLHLAGIRQDSGCPRCQEEEDTTVHFIAQRMCFNAL